MASATTLQNSIPGRHPFAFVPDRPRFARILVGVDFTEASMWALRLAIQLAEIYDSEIFLVHAVTPFARSLNPELKSPKDLRSALDQAREEMNSLAVENVKLRMVAHTTTVAYADADTLIDQVARVEQIDLIVVGSHRLSPIERVTLGSVSDAVLKSATCPVLIVGPACIHSRNPLESVVLATDLKSTDSVAMKYSASLAASGSGRLTLLHVIQNRTGRTNMTDQEAAERQMFQLLPANDSLATATEVRAEYGDPTEVIPAVLDVEAATMLVVGLRDGSNKWRAGTSTLLTSLIGESRCPVLAVRSLTI